MHSVLIKTVISLVLLSAFILTACSTNKIKSLTVVEKAQQLIKDQITNKQDTSNIPVKINFIMPEKAIVGEQIDIEIEFASDIALSELVLAYETSAGVSFRKKWYLFEQKNIIHKVKNIKADQLYRQTISLIPETDGMLHLNVYSIFPLGTEKIAGKSTLSISIGNSLKRLDKDTAGPAR